VVYILGNHERGKKQNCGPVPSTVPAPGNPRLVIRGKTLEVTGTNHQLGKGRWLPKRDLVQGRKQRTLVGKDKTPREKISVGYTYIKKWNARGGLECSGQSGHSHVTRGDQASDQLKTERRKAKTVKEKKRSRSQYGVAPSSKKKLPRFRWTLEKALKEEKRNPRCLQIKNSSRRKKECDGESSEKRSPTTREKKDMSN